MVFDKIRKEQKIRHIQVQSKLEDSLKKQKNVIPSSQFVRKKSTLRRRSSLGNASQDLNASFSSGGAVGRNSMSPPTMAAKQY